MLPVLAALLCLTALLTVLGLDAAVSDGNGLQSLIADLFPSREEPPEELPQEEPPPVTLEILPELTFKDVPAESGCCDALRYLTHYGYLGGMSEEQFAPEELVDRATVITALYRMSGEEAPDMGLSFSDVDEDLWYADAVTWGASAGVVTGEMGDRFAPEQAITRGELAVTVYRCALRFGCDMTVSGDLSAYLDGERVPPDMVEPLSWALERGFFRTVIRDEIFPLLPVNRLQLAEVLVGLCAARGDSLAREIHLAMPEKAPAVSALDHDAAQQVVETAAKKYGAVGVQVAVIENGTLTDTFAWGWAARNMTPMTTSHKIRIASVSKVLVGLAAILLQEEGVISLDESIGTYWECDAVNPYHRDTPVTVRSLLTHTSSVINAGDTVSRSYDRVREKLAGNGYSQSKPGAATSWSYNNYAYGVLGMTLELASGEYLSDVLDERLFSAMSIDGAFYAGELEGKKLVASLYRQNDTVALSAAAQRRLTRGAYPGASGLPFSGWFTVSARDLGKVVALLAGDGKYEGFSLMDPASIEMMETVFPLSDGSYQGIPMRWRRGLYGRDGIFYHTGSAYGVYTCVSYDPATGDGVVVLTTGASGSRDGNGIYSICSDISRYIYGALKE